MRFVAEIFIIFLSAGKIKSFADRVLSFRSVPVDPKEKRWDFSQCERVENGVTYRVYGDTLMNAAIGVSNTFILYDLYRK